jgi:hypothetical protein
MGFPDGRIPHAEVDERCDDCCLDRSRGRDCYRTVGGEYYVAQKAKVLARGKATVAANERCSRRARGLTKSDERPLISDQKRDLQRFMNTWLAT